MAVVVALIRALSALNSYIFIIVENNIIRKKYNYSGIHLYGCIDFCSLLQIN